MTGDAICTTCGQRTMHGRHLHGRACGLAPEAIGRIDPEDSSDGPIVILYPPSTCPPCSGTGRSAAIGFNCAACAGSGTRIEPKR